MKYGPHGYLKQEICRNSAWLERSVSELSTEIDRSPESFIAHYRDKYTSPDFPPVWMTAEIISFGQLSRWIANLKRPDRKEIAGEYGMGDEGLTTACRHLAIIRNKCAHHSRIWNKKFTVTMAVNKLPPKLQQGMQGADRKRMHNTLVVVDHLLSIASPNNNWRSQVVDLIEQCDLVNPVSSMGFPKDWRTRSVWQT